jgi:hypothetical protein
MGNFQTEEPMLGEEGVGPAVVVRALGYAPTFATLAENRTEAAT